MVSFDVSLIVAGLFSSLLILSAESGSARRFRQSHGHVPLFEIAENGVLRRIRLKPQTLRSYSRVKRSAEPRRLMAAKATAEHRYRHNCTSDSNDDKDPSNPSDTITNLSIDLLLLADDSVYESFLKASDDDEYSCVSAIYQYFSGILYEVSRIYSSKKLGDMTFTLYPVGIIITKHQSQVPWASEDMYESDGGTEHLKAAEALQAFKSWIQKERENLPEHDHAMAITKRDLSRSNDTSTQGIAYIRSICKFGESISLVEDIGGMATAAVAGHELAHSLGAQHDGGKVNDYCPTDHNYLMVPGISSSKDTVANTFTFSNCTVRQIREHVFRRNNSQPLDCLQRHHVRKRRHGGFRNVGAHPGQLFDANQQCQLAFGATYRYCNDNDYYLKQMCRRLWCKNLKEGKNGRCYTKQYLPALTGTTCGNRMWCFSGACVEDDLAPAVTDCKFGDRDVNFCLRLLVTKLRACAVPTFARFCCRTCAAFRLKNREKLFAQRPARKV